jgi:hypothetical protein
VVGVTDPYIAYVEWLGIRAQWKDAWIHAWFQTQSIELGLPAVRQCSHALTLGDGQYNLLHVLYADSHC